MNSPDLIQCHRSYVVNKNHIKIRKKDQLILVNQALVPISRGKRNFFDKLTLEELTGKKQQAATEYSLLLSFT
ncbi:MAG: LytTR family transcriptional regulator [Saprospiraceae bacterium]|nr:LytTR family transcriptional regulator [Saprospiraceae bacterium]MBK8855029.1 LytTR family transcriptional regulator [Saprospiraceae bacterium]MBK9044124.1 LytTR family transcriptional regulator [Saprospiraceae bacterium]